MRTRFMAIGAAVLVMASSLVAISDASASTNASRPATQRAATTASLGGDGKGATSTTSTSITARRTVHNNSAIPADSVITCTVAVDNPHNSGHVFGTVNVVARASCTAAVPQVSITAYLYPPVPYATVVGPTNSGTISVSSNAARSCSNGNWQGYGYMSVTFPPGYNPPTGSAGKFSPVISITC